MAPRSGSDRSLLLRRHALLLARAALIVVCLVVAVAIPGPAGAEGTRWQWPTPPPHQVEHLFDAPEHPYGPGHRGIDIAVPGAGTAVRAVEVGTVRFSGSVTGRGVVSVLHADGLISTYEPVIGSVEEGQSVQAGDVLGEMGAAGDGSHCPGQVCLHLGARRGQDYLDPMLLLGARSPSVLLPWGAGGAATGANSGAAPPASAASERSPASASAHGPDGAPAPRSSSTVATTDPTPSTSTPTMSAAPAPVMAGSPSRPGRGREFALLE